MFCEVSRYVKTSLAVVVVNSVVVSYSQSCRSCLELSRCCFLELVVSSCKSLS